jgi:hypothetical protein
MTQRQPQCDASNQQMMTVIIPGVVFETSQCDALERSKK